MKEAEAKKRIKHLVETINHHNYLYHTLDRPEISDFEFDQMFEELLSLEKQFPQLKSEDSPSQRVGAKPLDEFIKKQHREPMLSLQNTYSPEEISDFEEKIQRQLKSDKTIEYFCSPKFDGVAIELVFEEGLLTAAITRGDGTTGEDVISNVRTIRSLPLRLNGKKWPERIDVRGEILLFKEDFANINAYVEEQGEQTFANPRNAAAGTIRQLDSKIAARRNLRMFCYAYGYSEPKDLFASQSDFEGMMSDWGLPVMPSVKSLNGLKYGKKDWALSKICKGAKEVIEYYHAIEGLRHQLPFEIDGIVVKVNSFALQSKLGFIARSPRWAFAAKYKPEQEETVVEDIIVQVGRTGALTPVAKLRPVSVGGVTITNATLHNQDEIDRKDIRIGDHVIIHRAGDVIPEVVSVVEKKRPAGTKSFKIPNKCPICKEPVMQAEGEVIKRCVNTLCPAVVKESLKHFVSRNAMNIDKLGSRLIEVFFDEGLVRSFSDLYRLNQENILALDRQGEKSSQNIIKSIESSKNTDLHRFIFALGIRFVGEQTAKTLAKEFKSIDAFMAASHEDLINLRDIGPKVAESITLALKQKTFQKEVKDLIKEGITFKKIAKPKANGVFAGRSFLVTGSLPESRNVVHDMIEANGGQVLKSISKNVDVLVVGEKPGSKLTKAQELGIEVWDWDQFEKKLP